MGTDAYLDECRAKWLAAINTVTNGNPPASARWRGSAEIIRVLETVLRDATPHIHLPDGGGFDSKVIHRGRESGSIEFRVGPRGVYLVHPEELRMEHFPDDPSQSFFMLTLKNVPQTGVYELRLKYRQEELVDLGGAEYIERAHWDSQEYNGEDLPEDAELVVRHLGGKLLFVTKGSFWNSTPYTYNGEHDRLTAEEFRAGLQRAIDKSRS